MKNVSPANRRSAPGIAAASVRNLLLAAAAVTASSLALTPATASPARPLWQPPSEVAPVPAPVIRAVSITGNKELPTGLISDAAAKSIFGKPGDEAAVRAAVLAVIQVYRSRSLPVAQVVSTEVTSDGVLRLTIAEGTVRRIVVRGNAKTRTGIILKVLETKPGSVYRSDRAKNDRNQLARLGIFADVIVAPVVPGAADTPDPTTPATTAGGKAGDKAANEGTVPNPTAPPPGTSKGNEEVGGIGNPPPAPTPASGDKAAEAAAPPTPATPPPTADEDVVGLVDVVVRVKEVRTGNVAATFGYSDNSGLNGFLDLTENNIGGSAQRIAVQWQRLSILRTDQFGNQFQDGARQAFNISYAQPALSSRSLAYGVDLYNKQTVFQPFFSRNQDSIRNYETRRGGSARVGRLISRKASLYLSVRNDRIGYEDFLNIPSDLNVPQDLIDGADSTIGAVGLNLVLDGRNDADNPRYGYLNSFIVEQAGSFLGGNRNFGQARVDLRQYFALRPGATPPVFAVRLLGGTSFGGNVPLPEYFFLGGFDLLRGYNLYSIYGERMVLGSAEFRAPLSEGVQGVLFVDSGSAFGSANSFSLKTGAGVGLRFLTPIGPIRVDIAQGNRLQTYISLGQSF
ncbi:MAG: BamA/TamA family outer membrane protein [Cytophagales bacterium]|nr:BamA/TamA family outer membrane protein [Armatimonadota bacterium]